jgi:hypothetical protein
VGVTGTEEEEGGGEEEEKECPVMQMSILESGAEMKGRHTHFAKS